MTTVPADQPSPVCELYDAVFMGEMLCLHALVEKDSRGRFDVDELIHTSKVQELWLYDTYAIARTQNTVYKLTWAEPRPTTFNPKIKVHK